MVKLDFPINAFYFSACPNESRTQMTLGGQSSESKPHSDYLGAPLPATAMPLNRNSFDPSIPTHNAPSMPNSGTDSIVFDNVQAEDDDEDDEGHKKTPAKNKHAGRRKIKIEYITDKTRRHITFSKRKAGIMKKVMASVTSEKLTSSAAAIAAAD